MAAHGILESPQGKVMYACVSIGDSKLFMNDEFEGSPRTAPMNNSPVAFYLYVPDVDASFNQAVEGGMTTVA